MTIFANFEINLMSLILGFKWVLKPLCRLSKFYFAIAATLVLVGLMPEASIVLPSPKIWFFRNLPL